MLSRFAHQVIKVNSTLCRTKATKAASIAEKKIGPKSEEIFKKEAKYGAHNYSPLPVALAKGEGERKQLRMGSAIAKVKISKEQNKFRNVFLPIICIEEQHFCQINNHVFFHYSNMEAFIFYDSERCQKVCNIG